MFVSRNKKREKQHRKLYDTWWRQSINEWILQNSNINNWIWAFFCCSNTQCNHLFNLLPNQIQSMVFLFTFFTRENNVFCFFFFCGSGPWSHSQNARNFHLMKRPVVHFSKTNAVEMKRRKTINYVEKELEFSHCRGDANSTAINNNILKTIHVHLVTVEVECSGHIFNHIHRYHSKLPCRTGYL